METMTRNSGPMSMYGSKRGASAVTITTIIFAALFIGTSLYGYLLWQRIQWTEQKMQAAGLEVLDQRAAGATWEEIERQTLDDGRVELVYEYKAGGTTETVKTVDDLKAEVKAWETKRHKISNLLGFGYRTEGRTDHNLVAIILNRLANLKKRSTGEPWFTDLAGKELPEAINLDLSGQHGGVVEVQRNEDGVITSRRRKLTVDPTVFDGEDPAKTVYVYNMADLMAMDIPFTVEMLVDKLSGQIAGDRGLHGQVQGELTAIRAKWGSPDDLAGGRFREGWDLLQQYWPDGGKPVDYQEMSGAQRTQWENTISKDGFFGLESELRNSRIAAEDARREVDQLLGESFTNYKKRFDEIFGTWTWSMSRGFARKSDGLLEEKRAELGRKMEEVRKKRVVYLTRVQDFWRAKGRFDSEIADLKATLTNLRDPLAQRTPFEQYIAQIQAERRKRPEETALQKDGEIVYANSAQKIAYVNLSRKDGVFPGMTFDVYHFKKGGIPEKKGEVRVKNVGDDLSLVVMLSEAFTLNPIQEGDFVVNEVFDRGKKKYFTFAGRLSSAYTNEQATRLIEELGHFVESRVSAKTDYVILGMNYSGDENWVAAERLGIEQLTQGDLLRWLGKSE